MKKIILLLPVLFLSIVLVDTFSNQLSSYSDGGPVVADKGYTGSTFDNRTCATGGCHNTTETSDLVIETDIPEEGYVPGNTYEITISGSSANASKYGFQSMVEDETGESAGTFTAGVGTQLEGSNNQYITHSGAQLAQEASWTFSWEAPGAGTGSVIIYAAAIAANNNNSSSGDLGLKGQMSFMEQGANSVLQAGNSDEMKVYPSLVSSFFMLELGATQNVQVFDLSGKQLINKTFEKGAHQIDSDSWKKGMYLVQIGGETFKLIKR